MEPDKTYDKSKMPRRFSMEGAVAIIERERRDKRIHLYPSQLLNELKEADNPEMWLIDYFPDLLTSLEEFNLLSEDALKLPINLQEILRYVPDKSIRPVLFDEIKTTLLIKNIEQGE